ARAGLQAGDTIEAIDGCPVRDTDDLLLGISTRLAGAQAVLRARSLDQRKRDVTVTLAKYSLPSKVIATNRPRPVYGMRVDYTSLLIQPGFRFQRMPEGVFVREVELKSPAEAARLQDTVITHVNGKAVFSPPEFYREAEKATGSLELTLATLDENGQPRKVK